VPQQDLSSVSVGKLIPLYEFMTDHRSCTHNLSSCEIRKPEDQALISEVLKLCV